MQQTDIKGIQEQVTMSGKGDSPGIMQETDQI